MGSLLSLVFGLSSLIGLVVTSVVTGLAVIKGDYGVPAYTVILILAGINLALAVVCFFIVMRTDTLNQKNATLQPTIDSQNQKIRKLVYNSKKMERDYSEVVDILHSIHDQLRDRNFELSSAYLALESDEKISNLELIDLERTNEMFYLFVVDNIKSIFDIITGDKCAVCIKILDISDSPKNDTIMVRTFMRDSTSYRERKSSDKSIYQYPYYENTAFKTILSSKFPDSYYVSDDLAKESTYVNMNGSWKKYYNSTLVCPIRMELIEEEETPMSDYSVLGFICIDNIEGRMDNRLSIQLLAALSDSLFNHFLMFNVVRNGISSENTIDIEEKSTT